MHFKEIVRDDTQDRTGAPVESSPSEPNTHINMPCDYEVMAAWLMQHKKDKEEETHMKAYYIPEEISIMHIRFKIEQTNTIYVSSSSTTDCTIRLQGDLPEDRKQQALIKEVLAIILQLTGQADASHDHGIEATASALYGVLMENDIRQRPLE